MKFCEQVVTSVYLYVYRFNHLMSNDETILNGAHGARFKIYIIKIYILSPLERSQKREMKHWAMCFGLESYGQYTKVYFSIVLSNES